ncbi:MAG: hypothetical protein U1F81_21905 [Verrucomicrobiaceae bacterium]
MSTVIAEPASRLPAVVSRLQSLSAEDLEVVERVLLQLEINRTVSELDELSDDLRTSGMMERLPAIIQSVRERRAAAKAS